jgi:hypothetical protein
MKILYLILLFLLPLVQSARALGVTWGSEITSVFRDSYGEPLDNTFYVQLGFFEDTLAGPFVPDASNVDDWITQWRVFDEASINLAGPGVHDYYTSEAWVNLDGSSSSEDPNVSLGLNFVGEKAYVWLRNSDTPSPETEWFLARAESWVFPEGDDDCCDYELAAQWSVSDLVSGSVAPIWGRQTTEIGDGFDHTDGLTNTYDIQTLTFIPEPSSFLMAVLGSSLLLRRRRDQVIPSA